MGKGILVPVLALITGALFAGGVWGQRNSASGIFTGTVTRVDSVKKELVVRNEGGETIFQWNRETRINGSPVDKAGMHSENLKRGMMVTILCKEGKQVRVARRIDIKTSIVEVFKGLSFPFDCGVKIC